MADFNSNSPTVRGAEWRPSSARDLLLDASTKGVAMRFRGTAATYSHLHRFISAVQGTPGLGVEILTQLVPDGAGTFTARPNEDVAIGSWTEDDGTTTTIYDQIDESSIDLADYVKTTVTSETSYDFRVGIGSGNLSGKRLSSIALGVVTGTASGQRIMSIGALISGAGFFVGFRKNPLTSVTTPTLHTTSANIHPVTGLPWTIADAEAFDTTHGFRITGKSSGLGVEVRVYQSYADFNYFTENRLGSLYATGVPTLGWFEENISDAVLSASTYYYVHVFPLAGNAANWVKVPLLKDPNVVMALNAAASTGEHRVAYSTTLDSGNGIITSATELPGEMIPMLFDVSGTIQAQSNPYCGLV